MSKDPFRNFSTYKIDPLSEIRNAGIVTNGDVYWVSKVTDTRHTHRTDDLGQGVVKTSIQAGIDATRDDQNDVVFVIPGDGGTAWSAGTAVDLNKDRVKLVGAGYNDAKSSYSITVQDSMGTTPDTEVLAVTGDADKVAGLRFVGTLGTNAGGTMSNGIAFISGHDFWAEHSVFESSMNVWGTPSVVRGDGTGAHDARFDDCYFAVTGTGNVESAGNSALVIGGDGNKRWVFNDSVFRLPAGSTTETIFTPGTGAKETTRFNRCHFGLINGTAFAVTSAIRGSVTANNPVLLNYCSGIGFTQMGTDPNVYKTPALSGTRALVYDPGLAVGTAMLVAA